MSVLAPGRNLVLIGLMGAGKTTVGALVAARLGRPFVDTDRIVEEESGRSIPEIFSAHGEREFRRLEAEVVRHVAALRGQVLAVGGGAVTDPANRTQLRSTGDMVLLDASAEVLARRLGGPGEDTRPLLEGAEDLTVRLADLRALRERDYLRAASHVIDTAGKDPPTVVAEVLAWAATTPGLLTPEEHRGL